ncbi:hypothetical protein QUB80_30785 [Chlorogloeopsis sp. ULAP01]|nr:hypothetical protein [Chlorogloeopsis sp. ULAP01]MDM9385045.1 hypothetical protein [Chlorogloeopsis sp. ULAP01]
MAIITDAIAYAPSANHALLFGVCNLKSRGNLIVAYYNYTQGDRSQLNF